VLLPLFPVIQDGRFAELVHERIIKRKGTVKESFGVFSFGFCFWGLGCLLFRMDISTAVERVRARLAKQLNLATTSSTSASSSADESPESPPDAGGGGFELVTLQEWIRKEGGGAGGGEVVKCDGCEAPFLRGDEASICIACGSQRLTKLNNNATTKLDYKLSIAFSRFLETIHRSIEVGGSMNHQISMDSSSADQASATTTSKPPLQVASSIPSNPVPELSRKSLSALGRNAMVSPRSRQNSPGQNSSIDERMKFSSSSTMDVMANDFDDSLGTQEEDKATDTIFQKAEMLVLSQGGGDHGTDQDVRFLENLEVSYSMFAFLWLFVTVPNR
jgi:hypothetical protein